MGNPPRWCFPFLLLLLSGAPLTAQEPAAEAPVAAAPAVSGDTWPLYPGSESHVIERGPGGYASLFKIITLFLFTAVWVRLCDWVNRDCRSIGLPYALWNPVAVFPFLAVMLLFALTLPFYFFFHFVLLLASLAGPVAVYIVMRNKKVQPHQRVLTPDHFRHLASRKAGAFGVKVSAEKKAAHQQGPPIDLHTLPSGESQKDQAIEIQARNSPGYVPLKQLLGEMLDRRAERVLLDYTREGVATKFEIDGAWHEGEPRDRETADALLATLKGLARLNPEDRRGKQAGGFLAAHAKRKITGSVETQGTQTGERAVLTLREGVEFQTLDELGMREKMVEQWRSLLGGTEGGMLVISALPRNGLTAAWTVSLRSTDRMLRDFVAITTAGAAAEPEVENVEEVSYDPTTEEGKAAVVIPKLLRKQPDVVALPNGADPLAIDLVAAYVTREEKMGLLSLRAKDAVESLVRLLALKVDPDDVVPTLRAALHVRLIRKLCDKCKEAYTPTPELLQKLGIPEGRVASFYREAQPPADPKQHKPCEQCHDLGYYGRTAIFELLPVDENLRKALMSQPKLEVLRKLARQAGARTLQEEGILLVAKGVTSIKELQRVLSQ